MSDNQSRNQVDTAEPAANTPSGQGESCWQVLGLSPGACEHDIDEAYRERAKTAHPDAGGSDDAMKALNAARERAIDIITEDCWRQIKLEQAARERRARKALQANKTVLFDALEKAGITTVTLEFDGVGDSGQIDAIIAKTDNQTVGWPEQPVDLIHAAWDEAEPAGQIHSLRDAVEELAYDILEKMHGGWENNEGSYGEFAFDVNARTITLEMNERYTEVSTSVEQF